MRRLVDEHVGRGEHLIVLGDLNEGQPALDEPAVNLAALFDPDGPLVSSYDLHGFDVGKRPGTFDTCGIRNRLDYILVSHSLVPSFVGGHVFRTGLWGSRKTRPTDWDTYPEMTSWYTRAPTTPPSSSTLTCRQAGSAPPQQQSEPQLGFPSVHLPPVSPEQP